MDYSVTFTADSVLYFEDTSTRRGGSIRPIIVKTYSGSDTTSGWLVRMNNGSETVFGYFPLDSDITRLIESCR